MAFSKHKTTVLFDSSVYLSYYLQDTNYKIAEKMIAGFANYQSILLPDIVIGEVMNILVKKNAKRKLISKVIKLFIQDDICKTINVSKGFWYKDIRRLASKVNLKSNDLFILGFVAKFKPDIFFTLDKKLKKAYLSIINKKYE